MSEETWLAARLIPTSGINGAEEQERRATSALLAVMSAVREFGRTLTQPFGAPAGAVQTFIEVPFRLGERGAGRGSFIDSVLDAIDSFYVQVIQNLEPWLPAPPKLRPRTGRSSPSRSRRPSSRPRSPRRTDRSSSPRAPRQRWTRRMREPRRQRRDGPARRVVEGRQAGRAGTGCACPGPSPSPPGTGSNRSSSPGSKGSPMGVTGLPSGPRSPSRPAAWAGR